jgi:DNA-directed RNA polymerase omega subunit
MNDEKEVTKAAPTAAEPVEILKQERMPPIQSRFLYVDVTTKRAKQLRRGALPRLSALKRDSPTVTRQNAPHKIERIAMQEVDSGLIRYVVPNPTLPQPEKS